MDAAKRAWRWLTGRGLLFGCVALLLAVVAFFELVFPRMAQAIVGSANALPVPRTLYLWYVVIIVVAEALYVLSSDEALANFLDPLRRAARGQVGREQRILFIVALVLIPLIVAVGTFSRFVVSAEVPSVARQQHPGMSSASAAPYQGKPNPLRNPTPAMLAEFKTRYAAGEEVPDAPEDPTADVVVPSPPADDGEAAVAPEGAGQPAPEGAGQAAPEGAGPAAPAGAGAQPPPAAESDGGDADDDDGGGEGDDAAEGDDADEAEEDDEEDEEGIDARPPRRDVSALDDARLAQLYREAVIAEGRDLYFKNCIPCHGSKLDGDGQTSSAWTLRPIDFREAGTIETLVEDAVLWRVAEGGIGLPPIATPWDSTMPRWKADLTDEQMWKVITALYEDSGVEPRVLEFRLEQGGEGAQ